MAGNAAAGPVTDRFSLLTVSLSIGVIRLLSLPFLRWGLISLPAPANQSQSGLHNSIERNLGLKTDAYSAGYGI
jgi:hypothetical protein